MLQCRFGHPDEWQYFATHYERDTEALVKTHNVCFELLTKAAPVSKEQTVIYLVGGVCLKEFEEILLLVGNGYGGGATKLLRAFYERVITLTYLAKHPGKIDQFIEYTNIHWHKLLTEAERIHSKSGLTEEQLKEITGNFEASKEKFTEVVCKTCNKTRLQMSWTKKTNT